MNTAKTVRELRIVMTHVRDESKHIGFAPTMGNLHAGHVVLVEKVGGYADFVVINIFVSPLQFGPSEDFDKYPRILAAGQERLPEVDCHLLFTPIVEEMYPDGMDGQTRIHVPSVSEGPCGVSRPGHFEGVTTVVNELLNMVQPDLVLFGEKDFQQLAVIRKLVYNLNLSVQIFGELTVRIADGLALSSRNSYLDEQQRAVVPVIYRILRQLGERIHAGVEDFPALLADARQVLEQAGLRPDYLEIREPISLRPGVSDDYQPVILAAVYLGNTRLIDNLSVHLDWHVLSPRFPGVQAFTADSPYSVTPCGPDRNRPMYAIVLETKLHRAEVTHAVLDYEGSCAIGSGQLDLSEIREYEQVQIYNVGNGECFATYAIRAENGSKMISVNGAAARKAKVDDHVITCAYTHYNEVELANHKPHMLYMAPDNQLSHTGETIPIQVT